MDFAIGTECSVTCKLNPSRDVVACKFISRFIFKVGQVKRFQVRGELIFQCRCNTSDFLNFSELKYERKQVHFSPYIFFIIIPIYTYCIKEEIYSFALIHFQGCKFRDIGVHENKVKNSVDFIQTFIIQFNFSLKVVGKKLSNLF